MSRQCYYSTSDYQVVKAKIITNRMEGLIPLVRVRNPWGNETEWRGIWADGSEEWKFIPDHEKDYLSKIRKQSGFSNNSVVLCTNLYYYNNSS